MKYVMSPSSSVGQSARSFSSTMGPIKTKFDGKAPYHPKPRNLIPTPVPPPFPGQSVAGSIALASRVRFPPSPSYFLPTQPPY